MPSTIRDLTELTAVATDDYILISDTSDVVNRDKRISKLNFSGGLMTGGGTVATGGFTLTVPATGTAALKTGTPVAGRNAGWSDANTLLDSGFATTDIARLSIAQSFTALKTFSAGINLGQTTLSMYEEATWTPVVADAASGGNLATGTFIGNYIRVGNLVTLWATISNIVTSGMTGTNALYIRGIPYPVRTLTNYIACGQIYLSRFTFSLYVAATVTSGGSYVALTQMVSGTVVETPLTVSAVASSGFTDCYLTISYLV